MSSPKDMIVRGGNGTYKIAKLVGETKFARIYRCSNTSDPEREFILKVAIESANNDVLESEKDLLRQMYAESLLLETEYVEKFGKDAQLNYHFGFPQIVDSFTLNDQGDRLVTVCAFEAADKIETLTSLGLVKRLDGVRVDPKTSAWILGKVLKIIVFAHSLGIAVKDLSMDNVLIRREKHFVTIFDWSKAYKSDRLGEDEKMSDIVSATSAVVKILGGDAETGILLKDEQLSNDEYQVCIQDLLRGKCNDAQAAHKYFYSVVEKSWGRCFHPYTTYPLDY